MLRACWRLQFSNCFLTSFTTLLWEILTTFPGGPGGPWTPLMNRAKYVNHLILDKNVHMHFLKIKGNKPDFLSLLSVPQVQGCPMSEHRLIKMPSRWPLSLFLLSRPQWKSTRAHWKAVSMTIQKCVSHILSLFPGVPWFSFLSWLSTLTSQSLGGGSIKMNFVLI